MSRTCNFSILRSKVFSRRTVDWSKWPRRRPLHPRNRNLKGKASWTFRKIHQMRTQTLEDTTTKEVRVAKEAKTKLNSHSKITRYIKATSRMTWMKNYLVPLLHNKRSMRSRKWLLLLRHHRLKSSRNNQFNNRSQLSNLLKKPLHSSISFLQTLNKSNSNLNK